MNGRVPYYDRPLHRFVMQIVREHTDSEIRFHRSDKDPRVPWNIYAETDDSAIALNVILSPSAMRAIKREISERFPGVKVAYERTEWRSEID